MKTSPVLTNPWLIFFVTALGVGMSSLDSGIVNVALPTIAKQFQANLSYVQWVVSGYLLLLCISLPLFGRLGDLYSKRNIYLLGMLCFTISSALCGVAGSLWSLVLFRFLQGMSGAMIIANNKAIIMANFPKSKQGRALGFNSMTAAIGGFAGPALGGLLIMLGGWRLIFYINLPLGLLGCFIGYKIIPRDKAVERHKLDMLGPVLFMLAISAFVLMITNGTIWGWFSWQGLVLLLVAVVMFVAFSKWEKRIVYPMIDFALFKKAKYLNSSIQAFMIFLAVASNNILLPFYLINQLHLSAALSGCVLFIPPLMMILLAAPSGLLVDYIAANKVTTIGIIVTMLGLIVQSCTGESHYALLRVVIAQIIIGSGFALFVSPNNYIMMTSINTNEFGIASSIHSLMKNLGKIIGIAIATAIFSCLESYFISMSVSADFAFNIAFKVALLSTVLLLLLTIIFRMVKPLPSQDAN